MKILKTEIDGVYLIEPQVFGDSRGWFMETYSKLKLKDINIDFIQDNQSFSSQKNIIRGLHCQLNPHSQSKLIRCNKGQIYDVVVDIRIGSPTYLKWIKVLLTEDNKHQLFMPKGCLHGFVTLTDQVEVQYKVDAYYSAECDRSIKWNDPKLKIEWGIENPILSNKDANAPSLEDSDCIFYYK